MERFTRITALCTGCT